MRWLKWADELLEIYKQIRIRRVGDEIPLIVQGESDAQGVTIIYVYHHSNGSASAEFTGYRTRGSIDNQQDTQPNDKVVKYAGVGRSAGVPKQAGFIQIEASDLWGQNPVGGPGRLRIALSPPHNDAPVTVALAWHNLFEFLSEVCLPNNTMLCARKVDGTKFGMLFLDAQGRTGVQLNNMRLFISDADVVMTNGKPTSIKAVVNGALGMIPFVPD